MDVRRWRSRIHTLLLAGRCVTRAGPVNHGCGVLAVRRSSASVRPDHVRCGRCGARLARMAEYGDDREEKGPKMAANIAKPPGVAGKTPMGKWAFIIEPLLRGLGSFDIADRSLIRSNIDNKVPRLNKSFPRLNRKISTRDRRPRCRISARATPDFATAVRTRTTKQNMVRSRC